MTDNTTTEAAEAIETADAAESDAEDTNQALAHARRTLPLQQQLEALLLVADEPIGAVHLATAVDRPVRAVRHALAALVADYDGVGDGPQRGFELREVAGGYRFYVREALDVLVADFVQQQSPTRLSQAALETLAVIAYLQPVSRGRIAGVRGVNVDGVVRTLLVRGLIREEGTDPVTGAMTFATTPLFLQKLGLDSLRELPDLAPLLPDAVALEAELGQLAAEATTSAHEGDGHE